MTGIGRFARSFLFHIKITVREKSFLFWTLTYPILMATFFILAFGSLLNNEFNPVKVGITPNSSYALILKKVEVFDLEEMQEEEAKERLKKGEISGFVTEASKLMVEKEGTRATVIKSALDFIEQIKETDLPFWNFRFDIGYIRHVQQREASITVIFYSLIGMVALYGIYNGIEMVYTFQGNQSTIGARVQSTPMKKLHMIASGFLSGVLLNLISNILLLVFMRMVLRLELFTDYGRSLLLIFAANFLGVSLGIFLGVSNRMAEEMKMMTATMVSLFLSALSGMMGPVVRTLIYQYLPVIHRINPVSVLAENMYRLNFLKDSSFFFEGMLVLVVETLIFLGLSVLFLRRVQYDSI